MRNQSTGCRCGSFRAEQASIFVVNPASVDLDRCWAVLDRGEIARAQSYYFEGDRRAFVTTRASLRHAIGAITGIEPANLRFGVGAWGKPFVAFPALPCDLDFSVAHGREVALVAVACGGRIGIDVECQRDVEDWYQIATKTFGSEWVNRLAMLDADRRTKLFLRCWTVTEAYAKATGLGLAGLGGVVPLAPGTAFGDVKIAAGPPPRNGMEWSVMPLAVGSGHVASMILEVERGGPGCAPRCIPYEPSITQQQAIATQ